MPAISRARDDKFNERRAELGQATLQTLASLGYARTSLREIAQNSPYSHGVLHYYFSDKVDLILCSVRQYKSVCVTRYDQVTADATSYAELLERFCDKMAETLREETAMHRLWYDLRSQAMFEVALREDVLAIDKSLELMIWRVLSRFAELADAPVRASSEVAYAMFDGVFQHALQKYLLGDQGALVDLQASTSLLVKQLIEEPVALAVPARKKRSSRKAVV
ncbi:TetR/AcrR family transcriptional regulator [Diaphorobacter sp. HDW4A]|uniref:TetR/AcrR family transcriptional regulator n=1 Tax=Diaphorobacter sp. HDW4A TaxID=2714924 RepID=UPI00140B3192|nr:TetR/AcrR family transcriptional regulator [Diaphorobacter sp. HDW4A]QIL83512.1 TetR/AcrR family transcriptional regulator [Diaphorobacter sp. HDW4A]